MTTDSRFTNEQLTARRAASALALALGRSPFEKGNRRLTADLLKAQPASQDTLANTPPADPAAKVVVPRRSRQHTA